MDRGSYLDPFSTYSAEIKRSPRLTRTEERDLGILALKGDERAVGKLVSSNLRLVFYVAKEFGHEYSSFDDIVQVGGIGLLTAARKYNPSIGRFASFALPCIRSAVVTEYRKGLSIFSNGLPIKGLHKSLSGDPSLTYREEERTFNSEDVSSLLEVLNGSKLLSEREKKVVISYYGLDGERKNFRELGKEMGVDSERVRQINCDALDILRKRLRHKISL